jgi:hypothetical protein
MPEFSSEVAGTVSRASVIEVEGLGSGATRTVFSRAEIIAQRATYDAAFSENLVNIGILNSGLSVAQSDTSLMKSAFTVEFSNIRIENKDTILFKTYYIGLGY